MTTPFLTRLLLHTLADNISHRIYAKDAGGRFTFANRSVALGMGVSSPEELLGRTDADFYDARAASEYAAQERELMASGRAMVDCEEHVRYPLRGDEAWLLTTKVPLRGPRGKVIGLVGINYDVTKLKLNEQSLLQAKCEAEAAQQVLASTIERLNAEIASRRRLEDQLRRQASYDALTGLPNRQMLMERLEHAIGEAKRSQQGLTLLFIDLDRFKSVNDRFGHEMGDRLLRSIAERVARCVRAGDTFARLGGDEFVLLMANDVPEPTLAALIEQVTAAVGEPVAPEEGAGSVSVTCSVGCSVYPHDGADATSLLKHADAAMYDAKESGRNNIRRYSAAVQAKVSERFELEVELREAVERGEMRLHYQPQINLRSGRVSGVEALVRWQHPRLGLILPGRFIGIAEESGQIASIGQWVLRSACEQGVRWLRREMAPLRICVNISAAQFGCAQFESHIGAALSETGLPAKLLELELTETASMKHPENTIRVLGRLKALGLNIAIDDFGTGYSNLSYLQRFPADRLKIDRSFIVGGAQDAILEAIVAMAHKMNLDVVAEGVETQEQRDRVSALGCDQLQGYWFSRPVIAELIPALFDVRRRANAG